MKGRKAKKARDAKKEPENVGVVLPTDVVFVSRLDWGAAQTKGEMTMLEQPVKYVRLTDTGGIPCDTHHTCSDRMRKLQKDHSIYHSLVDIGYNFVVSADGKVYEGRGWHFAGEPLPEVKRVYKQCIQIAFVGRYGEKEIPAQAAVAVDNFLRYGVDSNIVVPNYKLIDLKSPFINAPYEEVKWSTEGLVDMDLTEEQLLRDVPK